MSFLIENKIEEITTALNQSSDVSSRVLLKENEKLGFVYLKSITDSTLFATAIYEPLQRFNGEVTFDTLIERLIKCNDVTEIEEEEVIDKILNGSVIVFLEKAQKLVNVDIQKFPTRPPTEPPTSPVIQGPREGFVEDIKTNITLLRRRLKNRNLVIQTHDVGKYSNTKVAITYLKGIAPKEVIKEVTEKIKAIDIDGIIDSYYVLTFLANRPDSLFKQVGNAEKPDIVVSKMLEGKVAIIVDNSPIVLTVPFVIFEDLQNANDYYTNHHYSSMIRVIRLLGLLVALISPGLYLALELHHYNVIPINFLVTIADTTQGLPFTPFLEILFIFLLFQILYEVSLRLPSYLGLATSVVGALILGDTGVKAGLISPPGVIIVALAKIALYTIPAQSSQITVLQFIFMVLGGSLGMLGLVGGIIYFINYLNGFDSYGTPYLSPYSPRINQDLKDGIFQSPLTEMKTRPKSYNSKNRVRQK